MGDRSASVLKETRAFFIQRLPIPLYIELSTTIPLRNYALDVFIESKKYSKP